MSCKGCCVCLELSKAEINKLKEIQFNKRNTKRKCKYCGILKPLNDYYNRWHRCKECLTSMSRENYKQKKNVIEREREIERMISDSLDII